MNNKNELCAHTDSLTLAKAAFAVYFISQSSQDIGEKPELTSQREQFGPEKSVKRGMRALRKDIGRNDESGR